ncbi:hypothetical protein DPMN_162214 [Dreissena polymorpha]|uniref:Uncharacterized protein n=1 Tax=Dreissena polymorpha TaxID=45954 RepID=A0A9D4EUG8_DREPO|nr:hypothetical protein DPMN_162214 [Dreissena polymorpha]
MDSSSSSKKPSSSAVGDDSSCRDGLCFFCTPYLSHSLLGMAKLKIQMSISDEHQII